MGIEEQKSGLGTFAEKVKAGPVRFLVPGACVAALAAAGVAGYTPLQYQAPEAQAQMQSTGKAHLGKNVDAKKLEKNHQESGKKPGAKKVAGAKAHDLRDGTFTGYARCTQSGVFDYYVALDVTIRGGKVVKIGNVRGTSQGHAGSADTGSYDQRNQRYLSRAALGSSSNQGVVAQLLAIAKSASSQSVDTVSGATYSSNALVEAYQDALSQATRSGALIKAAASALTTDKKPNASAGVSSAGKRHDVKAKAKVGAKAKLADGTFTGYDRCTEAGIFDYYVAVDVTVKKGKVVKLSRVRGTAKAGKGSKHLSGYQKVNDTYLCWAKSGRGTQVGVVQQIMTSAAKGKVASDVDTVSGATYSSESIVRAYQDALAKSAKKAGSKAKAATGTSKRHTAKGSGGNHDKNGRAKNTTVKPVKPKGGLADGTYTAYALAGKLNEYVGFDPYYVGVTITVKNGKVVALSQDDVAGDAAGVVNPRYLFNADDNEYYLNRALNGSRLLGQAGLLEQINKGIKVGSAVTSYDTVSGATYSSNAVAQAYSKAVKMAEAAKTKQDAGTTDASDENESGTDESDSDSTGGNDDSSTTGGFDSDATEASREGADSTATDADARDTQAGEAMTTQVVVSALTAAAGE